MDSPPDRRRRRSAGPGKRRCSETAPAGKTLRERHSLNLKRKRRENGDSSGDEIGGCRKRDVSRSKRMREDEDTSDDGLVLSQFLSKERKKQLSAPKMEKWDIDVRCEGKSGKLASKISLEFVDSSKAVKNRRARDRKLLNKEKSDRSNEHRSFMCHQCQRSDKNGVIFCSSCNKKRYCYDCITKWYPQKTREEIQNACPYCCGNCNCKACLREFLDVKPCNEVHESFKLQQLQYLLYKTLPVLRHIYRELSSELEFEAKIQGVQLTGKDIMRIKLGKNERLYCARSWVCFVREREGLPLFCYPTSEEKNLLAIVLDRGKKEL